MVYSQFFILSKVENSTNAVTTLQGTTRSTKDPLPMKDVELPDYGIALLAIAAFLIILVVLFVVVVVAFATMGKWSAKRHKIAPEFSLEDFHQQPPTI